MTINKQNLKLIRLHLASGAVNDSSFDMDACWSSGEIGCVIGHAAHSGIPELSVIDSEYNLTGGIFYGDYCERVFGLCCLKILWDFLFGAFWAENSETNTVSHAVRRLDFILAQDDGYDPKSLDEIIASFNCHKGE